MISRRRSRTNRTGRKRSQFRFELLEARTLLAADIMVDTPLDLVDPNDGLTSLREAVLAANNDPGSTIFLDAETYELTRTSPSDGPGFNDLDIHTGVSIVGQGAGQTVIDASALAADTNDSSDRVFHLFARGASTLTAAGALTAGDSPASLLTRLNDLDGILAPYIAGDSIRITGTTATGDEVDTQLAVDDTTILQDLIDRVNISWSDATLGVDGNGVLQLTSDSPNAADALSLVFTNDFQNTGSFEFSALEADEQLVPNVSIFGVTIQGGRADLGGGIYNQQARLTIQSSEISDNTAGDRGGGLYNSAGSVSVESSRIQNNQATVEGAAFQNVGGLVKLINTPLSGNTLGIADDGQLFEDIAQLMRDSRTEVVSGLNDFFGDLKSSMRDAYAEADLPIIGDQLNTALAPIYAGIDRLAFGVTDLMDAILSIDLPDSAPTLQEILQYAFYVTLGPGIAPAQSVVDQGGYSEYDELPPSVLDVLNPFTPQLLTYGGLNILKDGLDVDGETSPTDIIVTLGDDENGTRWIEFGFHVGQQETVDLAEGGFDLGISALPTFFETDQTDRFAGEVEAGDDVSYAAFLENFGVGIDLESSNGFRVDAKWDIRLGLGISERTGSGSRFEAFYINGGTTVSGRSDDTPIEELRASLEIFAAPDNEAVTFGQLFEDTVTTPNLQATASLGLLEASISDGTPAEVKITAPSPIPFDLGGGVFDETEFTIVITREEDGVITTETQDVELLAVQNIFAAPALLTTLNAQLYGDFGSILPPVSFDVDFSPINSFYNPEAPNTPFLVLTAREPEITNLEIRPSAGSGSAGAETFGFLPTQYEDRRVLGMGMGNNSVSTFDSLRGEHVLVGDLPAPASGVSLQDPEFRIWIGGTRNGDVTEDATSITVTWQEILNRTINTLESTGDVTVSLEDKLQDEINQELTAAGYTPGYVNVNVVDVAGQPHFEFSSPELLTVTYRVVDQTKLSVTAAIDITKPDFDNEASFVKDFPNDQRNFNRVTVGTIDDADNFTDVFDPTVKAESQIRLHFRSGASDGLEEQTSDLSSTPMGIPELTFDFKLDAAANFDAFLTDDDDEDDLRLFGDFFTVDTLQFANVQLDVRDLLESILVPVAETAAEVLQPVLDVIGGAASGVDSVFEARIPVLSDLAGTDYTLVDLFDIEVDENGDTAIDRFINTIDEAKDLASQVQEFLNGPDAGLGGFGEFTFGDFDIVLDPKSIFYFPRTKTPIPSSLATAEEQIRDTSVSSFMRFYTAFDSFSPPGFDVDLFRPQTIFNVLTGEPFNIVSFGLPAIEFDGGFEGSFGFSGFDLGLAANAAFDSNLRLVYDSKGIEQIVEAVRADTSIDWSDLLDGFAIQNNAGGFELGGSIEIFTWDGTEDSDGNPVATAVGVTTDEVTLTALVDVAATLGLEVQDPNNDGKLRLEEIFEITDDFADPEKLFCIVDITGNADFTVEGTAEFFGTGGSASLDAGVDSFSLQDLLSSLFGNCSETVPDAILAEEVTIDGESVLRINTGPYASARLYGDVDDGEDQVKRVVEDLRGFASIFEVDGSETRYDAPNSSGDYLPIEEIALPIDGATGLTPIAEVDPVTGSVVYRQSDSTTIESFSAPDANGRYYRSDEVDGTFLTVEGQGFTKWQRISDADEFLQKNGGTFSQFLEGNLFDQSQTEFGADGKIQLETDWLGAEVEYEYGADGRLNRVVERASDGTVTNTTNYYHGVENIDVRGTPGNVEVSGFGVPTQTFTGDYDKILAVGDSLDDSFVFSLLSGIPVELDGSGGNDFLRGSQANDTVEGGAGDDDIDAGDGDDIIDVGSGFNTVVDHDSSGDDVFHLQRNETGIELVSLGGNDTIYGTPFGDNFSVDSGSNGGVTIDGREGDDTISGGPGNDILLGGIGGDVLVGGAGDDFIDGQDGNDEIDGEDGDDELLGQDGFDTIVGGLGSDRLLGNAGRDILTAGLGDFLIDGGTGEDTLLFLMDDRPHTGVLTEAQYLEQGAQYPIAYQDVENLEVELGNGLGVPADSLNNYVLTLNGVQLPLVVRGGSGPDTVIAQQIPYLEQAVAIDLGEDDDLVVVRDSQRELNIAAGGQNVQDRLTIDRSMSEIPLVGDLSATAVAGLTSGLIGFEDFEALEIILSQFTDGFTVTSTSIPATIQGLGGDELFLLKDLSERVIFNGGYQATGDSGQFVALPGDDVIGQSDTDQLTVEILGDPSGLAANAYSDLIPNVERLRVDNSTNASIAVDWRYIDGKVQVGGTEILDTLGAELTIFDAGGEIDELLIQINSDLPQFVTSRQEEVRITEGTNVLSALDSESFQSFLTDETVDGLDGVTRVVASDDHRYVYATAEGDDSIAVFRINETGTLDFVQKLTDGILGVDGLRDASDVVLAQAIGDSDEFVYVTSPGDNAVSVFSRIPQTGRLVFREKIDLTFSPSRLAVGVDSSSGTHIIYVAGNDSGQGKLAAYSRNVMNTSLMPLGATLDVSESTFRRVQTDTSQQDVYFLTDTNLNRVGLNTNYALNTSDVESRAIIGHDLVIESASSTSSIAYVATNDGISAFTSSSGSLAAQATASELGGRPTFNALDAEGARISGAVDVDSVDPPVVEIIEYQITNVRLEVNEVADSRFAQDNKDELLFEYRDFDNGNDATFNSYTCENGGSGTTVEAGDVITSSRTLVINADYEASGQFFAEDKDCNALDSDDQIGAHGVFPNPSDFTPDTPSRDIVISWTPDSTPADYTLSYTLTAIYEVTQEFEAESINLFGSGGDGSLSFDVEIADPSNHLFESMTLADDSVFASDGDNDLIGMFSLSEHLGDLLDGTNQTVAAEFQPGVDQVQTAISADGNYLYATSARYGTLVGYQLDSTGAIGNEIETVQLGLLPDSMLAVGEGTAASKLFVTNPAEDSLLVFDVASNGTLELSQLFTDGVNGTEGLDGASGIAVDEGQVIVTGTEDDALARFSVGASGALTFTSTFTHPNLSNPDGIVLAPGASTAYVTSEANDSLWVISLNTASYSVEQQWRDGVNAEGLDGISSIAVEGSQLFATARNDSALTVFNRDSSGSLAVAEIIRDGEQGVAGLLDAGTVAATPDYVFASGGGDTLAVFSRNADGLRFEQRLRDAASGVNEIENGNSFLINADLGVLYVGSGGTETTTGGLSALEITPPASVEPRTFRVDHFNADNLTINTGDGGDIVEAGEMDATFTLNTQDGPDYVVLRNSYLETAIDLGDDGDDIEIWNSGDGVSLSVIGAGGQDSFLVLSTSPNSIVELFGGSDNDTFEVRGGRLESDVNIFGDAPTLTAISGNPGLEPGDTLLFDAQGGDADQSNANIPDGSVKMIGASHAAVYENIENVEIRTAPLADAGGPYTIVEGEPLELQGSVTAVGQTIVNVQWSFGGLSGELGSSENLTLNWNQLASIGVNDDGIYQVAVRVETELNGERFWDLATAELRVENLDPQLILASPTTVEAGTQFTLELSAIDPGDDTIKHWVIDWGDGSMNQEFVSPTVGVPHAYVEPGSYRITVFAEDEDGAYQASRLVTANSSRSLRGNLETFEGAEYLLNLDNPSGASITRLEINWDDGETSTVAGSSAASIPATHVFLDDGNYEISVSTTDQGGLVRDNLDPLYVVVRNVAPTIASLALVGGNEVTQGEPVDIIVTATDPGILDTISYLFDFDGDGRFEVSSSTALFTHVFSEVGTVAGAAIAIDDDGGISEPFPFNVVVSNALPQVTLRQTDEIALEGNPVSFEAAGSDPDGLPLNYEWDFDQDGVFELYTSTSNRASHVFPDNGTYPVAVRATDSNGGQSIAQLQVDVQNVAPIFVQPTTYLRLRSLRALDTFDPISDEPLILINGEEVFSANDDILALYVPNASPDGSIDLGPFYSRPLRESVVIELFEKNMTGNVQIGSALEIPFLSVPGIYEHDLMLSDASGITHYVLEYEISASRSIYASPSTEGTAVSISSAAFDPAGANDPLLFDFDFDFDGVYEVLATSGSTSYTFLDDGTYPVGIRVADDDGGVTETVTTIIVQNVAPTVEATGASSVPEGEVFTLSLGPIVDPGDDTVSEYIVYWGDGSLDVYTPQDVLDADGELTHVYSNVLFEQTIEIVLVDEDGPHGNAGEHTVFVTGATVIDETLFIGGFDDDDQVTINDLGNGDIKVHATFFVDSNFEVYDAESVERIVVYVYGGQDRVTVAGSIDIPAIIDGGDGDDHLNAGGGPTVLAGGAGNDRLIGGQSRNILIGGEGADTLTPGPEEDIVIGDRSIYDGDIANWEAFDLLLAEWDSERSFLERKQNIENSQGAVLDPVPYRLNPGETVFDDDAIDRILGDTQEDWVFDEAMALSGIGAAPGMGAPGSLDVDGDGVLSPRDALLLINALNQSDVQSSQFVSQHRKYDTNGDGFISAIDALLIINALNGLADGEAESVSFGPHQLARGETFVVESDEEEGEAESQAAIEEQLASLYIRRKV